jgi:hypothetical protein
VRQHGARSTLQGLGRHDHACLLYDDDAMFAAEVGGFVRDGLAAGERVIFVGTPPPGLDPAVEILAGEAETDLERLTATWEAMVGDALAYGHTGLRTVGEVTDLLIDEESRRRQLRWEARSDRLLAELPWTAICCYDRRRLPAEALRDVAAMHPIECGDHEPAFRLFSDGRARLAVAGELDSFETGRFTRLIELAAPPPPFELDLSRLEFADHHGVRAVAAMRNGEIELRGAPAAVQRIAGMIDVPLH